MIILFTRHARRKFDVLRRHRVHITEAMVVRAVERPEVMDYSRAPLRIAQVGIDADHVLRVVYRIEGSRRIIITFYPGRRSQYGAT